MPTPRSAVPANASGPRVDTFSVNRCADGDPGAAVTFDYVDKLQDEIGALKQKVAYIADNTQAKAWALVNVNAGVVTVGAGFNVSGVSIVSGKIRVSYTNPLASLNQAAVVTPLSAPFFAGIFNLATGSVDVEIDNSAGTPLNPSSAAYSFMIAVFGT